MHARGSRHRPASPAASGGQRRRADPRARHAALIREPSRQQAARRLPRAWDTVPGTTRGVPMKKEASVPFKEMAPRQKVVFVIKLAICIISFGMIFPNIMGD